MKTLLAISAISAATLGAQIQVTALQLNAMYDCSPSPLRMKVLSCAGAGDDAICEVQAFNRNQPGPHAKDTRRNVAGLLKACHVQSAAEAQADTRPAPAQASANGIKVGEEVDVLTGQGWTRARVVAVNGNNYRVDVSGIQVTKTYPAEVRRLGALTAQDHAAGQYQVGDRVQVLFEGRWIESKIHTEMGMEYQVDVPGNRLAWVKPQNLRPSSAPPPPGPMKAGTPPKPGLASCGSKYDGRWAAGGFGNFTIRFSGGKATVSYMGDDESLECWMGGGKIVLHKVGDDKNDMPIDINDDGSLSTPMGEIRRKGN